MHTRGTRALLLHVLGKAKNGGYPIVVQIKLVMNIYETNIGGLLMTRAIE